MALFKVKGTNELTPTRYSFMANLVTSKIGELAAFLEDFPVTDLGEDEVAFDMNVSDMLNHLEAVCGELRAHLQDFNSALNNRPKLPENQLGNDEDDDGDDGEGGEG